MIKNSFRGNVKIVIARDVRGGEVKLEMSFFSVLELKQFAQISGREFFRISHTQFTVRRA